MLEESQDNILTLEDRMHLSLNKFKRVIVYVIVISSAVFAFSGNGLYEITRIDSYLNHSGFNFPNLDDNTIYYHVSQVQFSIIISIIIVVIAMIWLASKGRKVMKELNDLQRQKIRQSYYLTFETSLALGENRIERIFYLISSVFPEIKEAKRNASKKGKKLYEIEEKINNFVYDLTVSTEEGLLLVKFFDKDLNFEDVHDFVRKTNNNFSKVRLFRVLCVAKGYNEIFYKDEVVTKMKDLYRKFKLDLIIEEEKGYSIIWID